MWSTRSIRGSRDLEFVKRRRNWRADRVYVLDDAGELVSLPVEWTDLAPADPFVVVAAGRAPFRTADLLKLADEVARLRSGAAGVQEILRGVHWILSHIRGGVTQIARLAEIASAYVPVVAVSARQQAIRTVTLGGRITWAEFRCGRHHGGTGRSKEASLAASRTLNPHPEGVIDPAFTSGAFFDPANLVQVKYEMVRAVEAGGLGAGAAASAFGLARQSYYNTRKALAERGLAGLIPAGPGPKGGHKLTAAVVDFLEQQHAAADPAPSSAQLAAPSRTGSASPCTNDRSSARSPPGAPPGTSSRRRPKAASTPPAGQDADAAALAGDYEHAVSPPAASATWRYGAAVLAASGMAAWMAAAGGGHPSPARRPA